MSSLQILQITNRIPWPLNDGGNIATYNVTRYLKALGHRVDLASLNTRKHYQDPAVLGDLVKVETVEIDTTLKIGGLIKGLFSPMPYNVSRFQSQGFADLLARLNSSNQYDIIQLEGIYLAIYLDAIRNSGPGKIVLRSHNVEHRIWERLAKAEGNILRKLYMRNLAGKIRQFELEALHRFDGIVAITEEEEAFYREQGFKGALTTVNAGVDLERFVPPAEPTPAQSVCFIGSLEWEPNVQGLTWFLEEVWKPLQTQFPDARFHIAGKHPPAYMEQWDYPGMVFHGMVPDAVQYLNQFRIFVVPLLSGGGMRLKIVEAMALGMCVLSTPVGAEGIAGTDGKDILLAESAKSFQDSLAQLFRNPEQSEAMGKAAVDTAHELYDWKNLVGRMAAFYQHLI